MTTNALIVLIITSFLVILLIVGLVYKLISKLIDQQSKSTVASADIVKVMDELIKSKTYNGTKLLPAPEENVEEVDDQIQHHIYDD
jgi:hypothetical protein